MKNIENIKILILEGGFNEEHEISINTSTQVKKSLTRLNIEFETIIVNPSTFENQLNNFDNDYLCFNALHGPFGEDGGIQKILDNYSFKYTHSSAESSAVGFNKILTKKAIQDTLIPTPEHIVIDYKDIKKEILYDSLMQFGSIIVKPVSSGSSFGIQIMKDKNAINNFINKINFNSNIYINHNELLIEKYIEGRELTVACIDRDSNSNAIEVTEIISNNEYFDYESKYTPGFSKHILPAQIPKNIYNDCKNFAKIAHDKILCQGVSRSDFIYTNNEIFFLEINTQPGLTPISLVPEQLDYQNISFDELIYNVIICAL